MSRLPSLILLILLLWASFAFGRSYGVRPIAGIFQQGPKAVLTIDYGEPPDGFREGDFYTLKVLKVRETKIDWGFVPLAVEDTL